MRARVAREGRVVEFISISLSLHSSEIFLGNGWPSSIAIAGAGRLESPEGADDSFAFKEDFCDTQQYLIQYVVHNQATVEGRI